MFPAITGTVLSLSEQLLLSLTEQHIVAKVRKWQLQREITTVINEALSATLQTYPGFNAAVEDKDYLGRPRVVEELKKLVDPVESVNTDVLFEEWNAHFGRPLQGDAKLILSTFISEVDKGLQHIEEIAEVLHRKETHLLALRPNTVAHSSLSSDQITIPNYSPVVDPRLQKYQAQIDICRDILHSGRPQAAKDQLLKLEASFRTESVTNELRHRLVTLIGACAFDLEDYEESARRFQQAYSLNPNDAGAIANLAVAHMLKGEPAKAAELATKALTIDPRGTSARGLRTLVLAKQRQYQSLDSLVEPEFLDDFSYVRALGAIFLEAQGFDQAEKYLRMAIAQDDTDIYSRLYLAQTLIQKHISIDDKSVFQPVRSQALIQPALNEARAVLDSALEIARHGDSRAYIHDVLVARSNLYALDGQVDKAKADCERVLEENPAHMSGIRNRALLAMQERKFDEALRYFEMLTIDQRLDDSVVFSAAQAYLETGKPEQAAELIAQKCKEPGSQADYRCLAVNARILVARGRYSEANTIKDALLKNHSDDPVALEVVAFIADLQKDTDGALYALQLASEIASQVDRDRIRLRIASFYFSRQLFREAIAWYEKINQTLLLEQPDLSAFITSLYMAQRYQDAYHVAKEAREKGIVNVVLVDIEAWIAEYVGDLAAAIQLCGILMQLQPRQMRHVLNKARLEFRFGKSDDATATLGRIDTTIVTDPMDLMQVAELTMLCGKLDEALPIAYRARQMGYGQADIHLYYVSLFLRIDEKVKGLRPEKVGPDTAVKVSVDHVMRWLKILVSAKPDNAQWEFDVNSDQARKLMGHLEGEIVEIKQSPFEIISLEIVEIQSIFVRAFQETLEVFGSLFPNHPGLHRMEIRDNDYTKFLTAVAGQSEFTQSAYQLYHDGALTLEQLSTLAGRLQIDLQQGIAGLAGHRILASGGTPQDQRAELQCAQAAEAVTLGLSSILTLGKLDLLVVTKRRFKKVHVAQQALDEIERTLADRSLSKDKGYHSIYYDNGRFVYQEIPPEVFSQGIERLQHVRDIVKEELDVTPVSPEYADLLKPSKEDINYAGLVGQASTIVAKQTGTALCADDLHLRQLAYQQNVNSFWSQTLLTELHAKGLIDDDRFADSCLELIRAHYYFTPVSVPILIRALTREGYQVTRQVEEIFTALRGPVTTPATAIGIASRIIKHVYMSKHPGINPISLLHLILQNLVHGRMPTPVLTQLGHALEVEFALSPLQLRQILTQIESWRVLVSAKQSFLL